MAYIRGEKERPASCVFCAKATGADDAAEQVIARSQHVFVTLNRFPYNTGHLLIVPFTHVASQEHLDTAVLTDLMVMTNRALAALRRLYDPPAFNLGANLGPAAGAGIADHYHFHIVPRWPGDANFMSVVGETRVLPDTLDNSYRELKKLWQDLFTDT
jgi:ATP adenylyltransferase